MGNFKLGGSFVAERLGNMQFNSEFLPILAECQQNFHLPEHVKEVF
jgi:hypothetical protein